MTYCFGNFDLCALKIKRKKEKEHKNSTLQSEADSDSGAYLGDYLPSLKDIGCT